MKKCGFSQRFKERSHKSHILSRLWNCQLQWDTKQCRSNWVLLSHTYHHITSWLHPTVFSYHVTYAFQSESMFYSCLNVKELFLPRNRRNILSLSDCNGTQTHNHLVLIQTLNHLASLAKWWSVRLRTKWLWIWVPLQSLPHPSPVLRKIISLSEKVTSMFLSVHQQIFTEALCYLDKISAKLFEIKMDFENDNYVHLKATSVA